MPRKPTPAAPGDDHRKRIKRSVLIRRDLLSQAQDAAAFLAGAPLYWSLADLMESALDRELARLRKAHNQGRDFPPRPKRAGGAGADE